MRCVFDTYCKEQDGSSFTAAATDNLSTDIIDHKVKSKVYSGKEQLYFHFRVTEAVDSAGDAATVNPKLYTHSTAAVKSGTLLIDMGTLAEATLVAYYHKQVPLAGLQFLRYSGVEFDVGTEDLTAGAFSAWIGPATQDNYFID